MWREKKARALVALLVAVLVTGVVAGCGGDGGSKRAPIAPGGANAPGSPEFGENTIRIPGVSASDVVGAAVLAAYPPSGAAPSGWIFVLGTDWRRFAVAAQFIAQPISAALLPMGNGYLPAAAVDLISRLHPTGFPKGAGLQTLFASTANEQILALIQQQNLKLTQVTAKTPDQLANDLVTYRGGWAGRYSNNVVIVSSDEQARDYSLPAAAWSAYSGDTLTFVSRGSVPATTRALLVQRQKLRIDKPSIYVIGPEPVISASVVKQLGAYGPVKRIAGVDAIDTAIKLAEFNDPKTHFGWGLKKGPANLSFVNIGHWGDSLGAINMAGAGPRAPVLLIDNADALPPRVSAYLQRLRNSQSNQGYVFGEPTSVSSPLFAQIDTLLAAP
jgi:putative cell wall binding repeat protein